MELNRYFSDTRENHPLSREQEQELTSRLEKCRKEDRDLLITSNLGFVITVASEYRGLGIPFEDLINEGNLGLIEASARYDPARGVRFITYAVWWIRKSILKAVSDNSTVVRVPSYRRKKMRQVRDAEKSLLGLLGRSPNRAELAERLSGAVATLDELLRTNPREVSIDEPCSSDSERAVGDLIADTSSVGAEERMLREEDGKLVRRAIKALSEIEQRILRDRFGMQGQPPLTLSDIGSKLGISRERVRQIEVQAKQKVRQSIHEWKRVQAPSKKPQTAPRPTRSPRSKH